MKSTLVTLVWWPHSGGRWLSRSILKNHSRVDQKTFVHPWIFNSTDDEMTNDLTAQIHKARSMPELNSHLENLYESTKIGRVAGLSNYYKNFIRSNEGTEGKRIIIGESCLGSPDPKHIDLNSIYEAFPEMKTIHLVRNPIDSYSSFKNRHEMDGDPIRIAGSWLSLNAKIRNFFNQRFSNQYHMIRYEDLMVDAEDEVKKICEFLAVDFEDSLIKSLGVRWGKNTPVTISEKEKQLIYSVAGSEMVHYEYKIES